jgi:hypothetical protein
MQFGDIAKIFQSLCEHPLSETTSDAMMAAIKQPKPANVCCVCVLQ